jgi:hypothetical protein
MNPSGFGEARNNNPNRTEKPTALKKPPERIPGSDSRISMVSIFNRIC